MSECATFSPKGLWPESLEESYRKSMKGLIVLAPRFNRNYSLRRPRVVEEAIASDALQKRREES